MLESVSHNPSWPRDWRYMIGSVLGWLTFLCAVVLLHMGHQGHWSQGMLWLLALVPAATVAINFVIAYRLIARQDEFVRALTAKRVIIAAGLAIIITTAWSVAESAGLPHLPAWFVYPLFWGLFGVVTPLVRGSAP